MKKSGILYILLALLMGVFIGCKAQFEPGTYTDDLGRPVVVEEVPHRLASFGPSITEILFALGLEEMVVGVSSYCDYPEAAQDMPKIGDAFNPSLERIVDLETDMVFTVKQEQLNSELESLDITFFVLDPKDIGDILADIEVVGRITGTGNEAEALVDEMQESLDTVATQVADVHPVRVLFIIDATDLTLPWTTGAGSFIDSLITLAGGENIAGGTEGNWLQFSLEQIVSSDPEVIIVQTMTGGVPTVTQEQLAAHPGWAEMTAVKEGDIRFVDGDLVSRPGPRIVLGLEAMARGIHPELYE